MSDGPWHAAAAGGGKASQELVGPLRGLATERQTIIPRRGSATRPSVLSKASPIDRAGGPWQRIAKDLPRDFADSVYDETPRPCRRLYTDQLLRPSWCSSLATSLQGYRAEVLDEILKEASLVLAASEARGESKSRLAEAKSPWPKRRQTKQQARRFFWHRQERISLSASR